MNQRAEYRLGNVHAVSNIHLIVSVTLQSVAKVLKVENILEDIVANVHLVQSRLRRPPFGCIDVRMQGRIQVFRKGGVQYILCSHVACLKKGAGVLHACQHLGVRANIHWGGGQTEFCQNGFRWGGGSSRNVPGSIFCGVAELVSLTAVTEIAKYLVKGRGKDKCPHKSGSKTSCPRFFQLYCIDKTL